MNKELRILSRGSPLAIKQVYEVMRQFPAIPYLIIKLDSIGDKDKATSLLSDVPSDFFTRELDEALLSGQGDLAIHSAKDLPFPLPRGIIVAALTGSLDPSDALVTARKTPLAALPAGSVIGTSSLLRQQQLTALRPDLHVKSIRGTIEERLAQLQTGIYDGVIIATCALIRLGYQDLITEILPFETHPLQGCLAITVRAQSSELKTRLLALFQRCDVRNSYGKVYLVGAGTGDPDLLTYKARQVLDQAEVIIYDDLINPQILADSEAQLIYAGKRKGAHTVRQEEINKLLYQKAAAGYKVVRLKGGDPLLFARTAEELDFLQARFITTEIVPGISAAAAAATACNIPFTSRELAHDVTFLSAHNAAGNEDSAFATMRPPTNDTLVYFMGASKLNEISNQLLEQGRNPDTPVLLIHRAGFPEEKIALTSIGKMGDSQLGSPLIVIAGRIAQMYRRDATILYTGLEKPIFHLLFRGRIIHYPLIQTRRSAGLKEVQLEHYDGIIFTSQTAVRFFCMAHKLTGQRIFAIGAKTAHAISGFGYQAEAIAEPAHSAALAKLIRAYPSLKFLYPCSDRSANGLHQLARVTPVIIYTVSEREQPLINLEEIDSIVFTSPSTVGAFYQLYKEFPKHILYYVQGPVTCKKLKQFHVSEEVIIDVQEIQTQKAGCPDQEALSGN